MNLFLGDNITSAIDVMVNYFMKIFDWIFSLTIPGTDFPLYILWIIGAIINVILVILKSAPSGFSSFRSSVRDTSKSGARALKGGASKYRESRIKEDNPKSGGGE